MVEPVEARIGEVLTERGATIAVAESCTGGLLGSLLTDVPGASEYFLGGIISYVERTKLQHLAVSRESLERHGAVSEPVAREMAQHIRDEADATWGVSTTGYAGPGAEASEPVGSVYIGIAHAGDGETGSSTTVEHHQFAGDRHEIKATVAEQALESTLAEMD